MVPHAPKTHTFLIIIFELPNMYTFRISMFPRPKMVEITAGPKLNTMYYKHPYSINFLVIALCPVWGWRKRYHLWKLDKPFLRYHHLKIQKRSIFAESALFWISKCRYLSNGNSDGTKTMHIWKILNTHYHF